VGIARQIGENRSRSGEGFFGVDNPLGLAQRIEVALESGAIGERCVVVEEAQIAGLVGGSQLFEEEPPEQP